MSDPIDIKTKKIFIEQKFKEQKTLDKDIILDALEKSLIDHMDLWGKFQQQWCNRAFNTFKDYDKYLILIYFFKHIWQELSDKFNYKGMEEFYSHDKFKIEKINLIKISENLGIPKETIRRKVNELQKENILIREGKSIYLNRTAISHQKPVNTIELLSLFLQKKSEYLGNYPWFGRSMSKEEIKTFIEKYFTVVWLRYFKLQMPFLIRQRKLFTDLEMWNVWGVIALNHQYMFKKKQNKIIIQEKLGYKNYLSSIMAEKPDHGINGSSISDVSGIPRATVLRKLKWLISFGLVKKNKKSEFILNSSGKKNKKIDENFNQTQVETCEFIADVFDLIKNSKFTI